MEVDFVDTKLRDACRKEAELRKLWGRDRAYALQLRIIQLISAPCLADIAAIRPALLVKCEESVGRFYLTVDNKIRICFECVSPDGNNEPDSPNFLMQTTVINVLSIEEVE